MIHDAEFTPVLIRSGYGGPRVVVGECSDTPSTNELIAAAVDRFKNAPRGGKIVILTSGTTGVPKGAARTPRFRAQSGPLRTLLTRIPFLAGSPIFIAPPLFHGMGFAYLDLSLFLGATVGVRKRFDATEVLADLARYKCRVMIAVPSMLRRLLDVPESVREKYDLSALRAVVVSGSALGVELCNPVHGGVRAVHLQPVRYIGNGFWARPSPPPTTCVLRRGRLVYPPAEYRSAHFGRFDGRILAAGHCRGACF